jgi:hypothetical protein
VVKTVDATFLFAYRRGITGRCSNILTHNMLCTDYINIISRSLSLSSTNSIIFVFNVLCNTVTQVYGGGINAETCRGINKSMNQHLFWCVLDQLANYTASRSDRNLLSACVKAKFRSFSAVLLLDVHAHPDSLYAQPDYLRIAIALCVLCHVLCPYAYSRSV